MELGQRTLTFCYYIYVHQETTILAQIRVALEFAIIGTPYENLGPSTNAKAATAKIDTDVTHANILEKVQVIGLTAPYTNETTPTLVWLEVFPNRWTQSSRVNLSP